MRIIKLLLNQFSLDWFEEKRISFHPESGIRLKPGGYVLFDEKLSLEPYIGIYQGITISPMGFMSYTNSPIPQTTTMGRYCSIARGVVFPGPRHPVEHVSTSVFTHFPTTDLVQRVVRDMRPDFAKFYANPEKEPTSIGHDVWIGQGVAIMPGLTIGTGAVLAAHSVVTRSVQPYEIVGGNPARPIRKRFPDEIIARLLDSRWWDYRFTDLAGFDIGNPEKFLDVFEKEKGSIEPYSPPPIHMMELVKLIQAQVAGKAKTGV